MSKMFNIMVVILALALSTSSLRLTHNQQWDSLISDLISNSKDANGVPIVDRATILLLAGGTPFISSSSPNALQITPTEAKLVAKIMQTEEI